MSVLRHLVGCMAAHADQCVSLKWKGIHSGAFKDSETEDPSRRFSVMQTVRQTGKHTDVFLEVPFSLAHAWCTPLLEPRRIHLQQEGYSITKRGRQIETPELSSTMAPRSSFRAKIDGQGSFRCREPG